ncbi:MAG: spoIIIJ-associated protein [Acidimicrobiaceae bacterium]
MEWVETTGRTVADAKEAALDQLGVDESDAEFEVLEEPRSGLFGRVRGEARVRARVRPTSPRPKVERRDRRKRREGSGEGRGAATSQGGRAAEPKAEGQRARATTASDDGPRDGRSRRGGRGGRGGAGRSRGGAVGASAGTKIDETTGAATASDKEGTTMGNDATVEEQAAITRTFLTGLVEVFDLDFELREERIDEDTIELAIDGDDLGLLIGPKGQTLQAVQELARTVVQRKATGTHFGRIRLDIGGYRQRRREALERFATQVAEDVRGSGIAKALEPMHPADRKVVHDTVNELEGVITSSEGEEPRRRVVISPAASS